MSFPLEFEDWDMSATTQPGKRLHNELENHHGEIHHKWWFSSSLCKRHYQRVDLKTTVVGMPETGHRRRNHLFVRCHRTEWFVWSVDIRLVVSPYPSEKWWSSSVGIMNFPTEWKNKIHFPNHQPVMTISISSCHTQKEYLLLLLSMSRKPKHTHT